NTCLVSIMITQIPRVTIFPYTTLFRSLWINGQHPCYALKKIFIKAGTKTSLQYHRFKQETNVLFEGLAKLHYKKNMSIQNDLVRDRKSTRLNSSHQIISYAVLFLTKKN